MSNASTNGKRDTVLDVTAQQVARVYAQALLGAAVNAGQLEDVVETLDSLVDDVLERHPELERVFTSALISSEEKEGMLERVFGARGSRIVLSFLKVLAHHGRLNLLRDVRRELRTLYNRHRNFAEVSIRVAREIDAVTVEELRRTLKETLSQEPILNVTVDPSLIAGVVIRMGDTVYDASVATRFRRAQNAMVQNAVELIQTNRDKLVAS